MILRIFRGHVTAADREGFTAFVREYALARALAVPGLLSFQPGYRVDGEGLEVVLVSTWEEFAAIAMRDHDLDQPIALPGAGQFISAGRAAHYELVAGSIHSLPLAGASMRILTGNLRPNSDAAYFEWSRRDRERLIDAGRIYGAHLGRRLSDNTEEVAFVALLPPGAAHDEASDPDSGGPAMKQSLEFFTDNWVMTEYEALIAGPISPAAPALLLADNERRYLYATPEAARLTGRPIGRLLSMSVEDLAPPELVPLVPKLWRDFLAAGSQDGPFVLLSPTGERHEVSYHARAHLPWRGVHTSLMVPLGESAEPDVDGALVAAGIVARHVPPALDAH